jgi:hypothetical protein
MTGKQLIPPILSDHYNADYFTDKHFTKRKIAELGIGAES